MCAHCNRSKRHELYGRCSKSWCSSGPTSAAGFVLWARRGLRPSSYTHSSSCSCLGFGLGLGLWQQALHTDCCFFVSSNSRHQGLWNGSQRITTRSSSHCCLTKNKKVQFDETTHLLNRYHVWPDTNTSSHVACLQRSTGRFHLGEMMLHISNAAVLMHSGLRCAASGQLAGCTGTVGILRSRHVVFLQDCTPTLVTSSSQIGNNDGQLNKHKHVILFILFIDVSLYIYI